MSPGPFSVLIPSYNHARFLSGAVLSAWRDPLVGEILIVDDGSTDGSRDMAERLGRSCGPRVRCLDEAPHDNRGAPERLNQLVRAARFEWLAILNSDDQFVPGRFEAVRAAIGRTPGDFYFGNILIIDKDGRVTGGKRPFFDYEYPLDRQLSDLGIGRESLIGHLSNQNIIATTSNAIFTRALYDRVGGFADFRYVHDWDFFLRAAWHGTAQYVPQPFTLYRQHGSNTISEGGERIKKEAQDLFKRVLADIPEMAIRRVVRLGLSSNRYLQPDHLTSLNAHHITLCMSEKLRAAYWPTGEGIPAWARTDQGTYFYEPDEAGTVLTLGQIENGLLALSVQSLDFAVISHSLAPPAVAPVGELRNACLFNEAARPLVEGGPRPGRPLHGRLLRLLPGPPGDQAGSTIGTLIAGSDVAGDGLIGVNVSTGRRKPKPGYVPLPALTLPKRTQKKRVLVFPVFMAVGGVERLAVEVIGALGERYDFCVVTFERLTAEQGSLHHQLASLGVAFFDLGEIAGQSLHLRLVDLIATQFAPDLVWICNGSPWLVRNAANLRRRFFDIPIVDQQVYDTVIGWVAYYDDPGIRSFDRFIAINARIADVFAARFGIAESRIDLIRHGINTEEFDGATLDDGDRRRIRQGWGVNPDHRCFAFIGRLTEQKGPLRFLAIAEAARIARMPVSFLMVGDGNLAGVVDQAIAERGLVNLRRIKYSPHPKQIYQAIDGLILTSKYEGLPIVCLEALAQGLPVLATDVGDIGWAVGQFGAGAVVEPGTGAREFFSAFQRWNDRLDDHAAEARRRSAAARKEFGIARCAAQYDDCWRRAIEVRRGVRA
jgi:glycosyltransferase involved in cell wall biosynthesis